ncbi:Gfo/Idh/MocA family protein [Exiguobacterium algae]|uniref:Gfo/Idh/MocA family protein n=1 Tax=Exiguobacterium algae TaxID=2751250 RepID=UPI001BE73AE5|nr:Gfo/Idh/MocA family oxidoreductase [Exiguobacterium algae]
MNLLVVGIGDVAKKAYLPVYAGMKNINVFLVSRDREKAEEMVARYRFSGAYETIESVPLEEIDAVMIHSTTAAHGHQAEYFLKNGKHVFIDKPVTFKYEETEQLVRIAEKNGVHLVTGFNRRFATATQALKEVTDPNMVVIQKNRTYSPATLREFIIEDFVHVVDTLRYLTNSAPVDGLHVTTRVEEGILKQLMIQFTAGGVLAVGVMNRDSGCTEEVMEVMSPDVKRVSRDVERVYDYTPAGVQERALSPWESNLKRRGFTTMLEAFVQLLEGEPNGSVLAEDSLETHRICEEILKEV